MLNIPWLEPSFYFYFSLFHYQNCLAVVYLFFPVNRISFILLPIQSFGRFTLNIEFKSSKNIFSFFVGRHFFV